MTGAMSGALRDVLLLGPELLLALAGILLLCAGAIGRGVGARESAWIAGGSVALAGGVLVEIRRMAAGRVVALFDGAFVLDGYALFWKFLLLASAAIVVLLSVRFVEPIARRASEYFALLLIAVAGMMLMVSALDLISLWISLETMALASYVLAGFWKRERRSNEAALKYFVLGALSSGVLLYGISLLYGATGTLHLEGLWRTLPGAWSQGWLAPLGTILLLAGLFFKISAAPFHVWTPDVYVGAPTPITAFLASASKIASFAVLARVLLDGLSGARGQWQLLVAAVSIASMVWGNVAALTQDNVKRLLAYSSIAHAGYLLIGVLTASRVGLWAALFYAAAYAFMTLGAFAIVIVLERREYAGETCADYAGLARRSPALAAAMLLFLVGLTGIPPTGGFFGKVFLFAAAVQTGWTWVAVVGVVTSAISLYYYFRIAVFMYLEADPREAPAPLAAPSLASAIAVCAAVTLALGLYPAPVIALVEQSLLALR